jgi:hypothetical protein
VSIAAVEEQKMLKFVNDHWQVFNEEWFETFGVNIRIQHADPETYAWMIWLALLMPHHLSYNSLISFMFVCTLMLLWTPTRKAVHLQPFHQRIRTGKYS